MPLGRIVSHVILISALGFSIQVSANSSISQVAAEGQGIGVAISNWTPHTISSFEPVYENDGLVGPGFPETILPYQNTGTAVVMRGGPASEGEVLITYDIITDNGFVPSFGISFEANTDWDVKAAASDVLHAVKKKVTSNAKDSLKKTATESGEDALEAAGAADGMTEAYAALKVMEDIGKLFKALDPSYQMLFSWVPTSGPFTENACISADTNTPAPVNVAILGSVAGITPTAENKDDFFILSAGSVNEYLPGFVDMSISPMCDYVCAAWNATGEYLNDYSQSDCTSATSGSDALTNYDEFDNQNTCLVEPSEGSEGVPWVTPPTATYQRLVPPDNCTTPVNAGYLPAAEGICGACVEAESGAPAGSWSESCNLDSFSGTTLCADCANDRKSDRVNYSCASCSNEVWNNDNGTLSCDTAPPPGSWLDSCDSDWSYNGTAQTLCATCETPGGGGSTYSCQTCSSNTWTNSDGLLLCAASAASAGDVAPVSPFLRASPPLYAQLFAAPPPNLSMPLAGASR